MILGSSLCALTVSVLSTTLPLPGAGTVLGHTKISATVGGFQGSLESFDQFGRAVSVLGDLDGDGIEELVVGAHGDDGASIDEGAAWILFLNPDQTVRNEQKIAAAVGGFDGVLSPQARFGRSVAGIGDLDGDGVVDLAVGASKDDDGGVDRGAVWILFLYADGTVKAHQKISATAGGFAGVLVDNAQFGRSLEKIGDLDGDGVTDLAVGATGDDDGGTAPLMGSVWILFLNTDGTVKAEQKIANGVGGLGTVLVARAFFGYAVASLGDLDGDGVVDLAAGAPTDGGAGARTGAFWVLFMNPDGTVRAHQKVSNQTGGFGGDVEPFDNFGGSLEGLGDLDGDGVPDVAVGALQDDDGGADHGAVWILFLNPDGRVAGEQKISSTQGGFSGVLDRDDRFSTGLANLGDVDGDSIQDLAVGARFDDDGGTNAGAVWILYLSGTVTTPPVASFHASPVQGVVPLDVDFTDTSSGLVDTWDWEFGDGNLSSAVNPQYTYGAAGTYSVSLTVSGALGSDQVTSTDLIVVVDPPKPGIADGGFEGQASGGLPTIPWHVESGAEHLVHPVGLSTDGPFPTADAQWLEVSAAGTADATPPSAPGGVTIPAVGGAGVSQYFLQPSGMGVLEVDAAFLLDGGFSDSSFNDWMSIDVSDGITTWNLFYADSFSAFPDVSAQYVLPMTAMETASVDLASAFPGSSSSTLFLLTIQVGNGGDGLRDSRGYVDAIRLAGGGGSITIFGSGVNPPGSLIHLSGTSSIGDTVVFGIDNPLGTQAAGSATFLMVSMFPDANYPAGTLLNGFGMAGAGLPGELLVSRTSPDPFLTLYGPPWSGPGMPAPIPFAMPRVTSWVGVTIYAQGVIHDFAASQGVRYGLADAAEIVIGL